MKTIIALFVSLLTLVTQANGFYPNGTRMVYAGYSGVPGRDLTNGFTVAGPVYGAQEKFMQQCMEAGYPVIPQLNNNLTFNDKATNKYVVVEQDLRARLIEQIDRYKGYTNIVWWSLTPEELRPWRKDEMKYLDLSVQMIRELDPLKRPIFMYHPNHRGIPELTTFAKSFDVLGKGRYVNSSGKKRSRQWVRQGVEEELEAIRLSGRKNVIALVMPEFCKDPDDPAEDKEIRSWVRHDVYLGLCSGAKGVLLWSLWPRKEVRRTWKTWYDAYAECGRELNGEQQLALPFLFGEVRSDLNIQRTSKHSDELTNGGEVETTTTTDAERVQRKATVPSWTARVLVYNNKRFVFIVNSANEPATFEITGWKTDQRVKDLFTHETLNVLPKTIQIPAYGVIAFLEESQPTTSAAAIIPQPNTIATQPGTFDWANARAIHYLDTPDTKTAALVFAKQLFAVTARQLPVTPFDGQNAKGAIVLTTPKQKLTSESYTLTVSSESITCTASDYAGYYYALQTLLQLLPTSAPYHIPCTDIADVPRFSWRGLMVDESRHFFGVKKIKQTLDMMALHKMNRFHWHLTDTPGWRIEIKKYPKLTSVGAIGNQSEPTAPAEFYTQDEIRDMVAYAAERAIVIVPEIDMPGHADAMNKAYPAFSGGGNQKLPLFTINPGKEETYTYLGDILKEVAELFPGQWIHYGGDEVHFANKQWADLPEVKALMAREKLPDLVAVERYFNRRMAKVIRDLGKVCVGWDEIANSGLPTSGTLIDWWRHDKLPALADALTKGFDVVLCPRHPCYFDFVQHESHKDGRRWNGFNDLKRVYDFGDLDALKVTPDHVKQIQGMQACLWTEVVKTPERFDFMTYPRLSALAEASWTHPAAKNYEDFLTRLPAVMKRYQAAGIHAYDPFANSPEVRFKAKATTEYIDPPSK
jgi:hexosaminidase